MMSSVCSVYWGGSSCLMTPLILTSDVLLTQTLSLESVRLVMNKLWPRFLLLLSLSVSHSPVSLYHTAMLLFLHIRLFLVTISLLKQTCYPFFLQRVQLWDLLVHTQPLHCLLHHPYGAHGRVSLVRGFISARVGEFSCTVGTFNLHLNRYFLRPR